MRPFLFYATAILIIICDQVSKFVVGSRLHPGDPSIPVFGKYFVLTHLNNYGGAFSILQTSPLVFVVIAVLAIWALLYAYYRSSRNDLIVSAAIALALGGAVGNLIDRVRYGFVIDFFDIQNGHGRNLWPVFNVADSAITVGIIVLFWHFIFRRAPQKELVTERRAEDEAAIAPISETAAANTQSPTPNA